MLAWLRSFLGRPTVTVSSTVKPPPCWGPFSASAYGRHYVSLWRGIDSGLGCNIIAAYDSSSELWSLLPTTGPLPPGQYGGCFVCVGHWLYTFGGEDRVYKNCVNRLNLDTLEWTKVQTSGTQPMKKAYCGLVRVNERTVCCFGGKGIEGPTQPGSTCTSIQWSHGCVQTNEFHLFDIQNGNAHIPGVWSSPELRGERPPPCSAFTFTMVDQHRAVLFGGWQPGRGSNVNDVYLFDFRTMEVTKVKPVLREPWPVGRSDHAACCLNYGQDLPQLLVHGGWDRKVLGDLWILDVHTGKWAEVIPPRSVKSHCLHSITAISLGPGLTKVLMFGGRHTFPGNAIAETTLLRFELTEPSAGKWALVDVATRGSARRLSEKRPRIRQETCV